MPVRRGLIFASLGGVAIALAATAWIICAPGVGPGGGEDWMVFHTVARGWLHGDFALAFDGNRLTALINVEHAQWLAHPLHLHPWLYPPTFLLLLLLFGVLPFFLSWGLFQAVTAGLLLLVLWHACPTSSSRTLLIVAVALCPAVPIELILGQNAFLTSALLVGGFALLPSAPLLGGVLLGVLSIKPQLALLVPVALLVGGNRRALGGMVLGAAALALASVAVFGWTFWTQWFELMLLPNPILHAWQAVARDNGVSLFAWAAALGAGPTLANIVQAAGTVAVAAAVVALMRRQLDPTFRLAGLLIAAILAAPHAMNYDMIMLGIAAALIFFHELPHGIRGGDIILCFLLWASPLAIPPAASPMGLFTPLLLAWGLVRLIRSKPTLAEPAEKKAREGALISQPLLPARNG